METEMDVRSFVRGLPKAELHMHLEGSLEPEMLMRLAARNKVEVPFRSVEEIRDAYRFTELQDFLDVYYQGMNVLREEEDFHDLTTAYLERAAADGAVHVEVFYDPQGHTARGIPFSTVTDGILAALAEGRERLGVTSLLILCILRHLPEDEGFATFREAEPYVAGGRIAGLGLDSTERDNPPAKFRRLFAAAREARAEAGRPRGRGRPGRLRRRRGGPARGGPGSTTATARWKTRRWSAAWPRAASRSPCARSPTSGSGASPICGGIR